MFLDGANSLKNIVSRAHLAILAFKMPESLDIRPFYVLEPEDGKEITVEAARSLLEACSLKQRHDAYVFIKEAEKLNLAAQNALLKLFEEPNSHYHFLLFTENPAVLLPTILSRAEIYYLRRENSLSAQIEASEEVKTLARELLSADERGKVALADKLAKHKGGARAYTLEVLDTAIEMAHKSYFATGKSAFLKKLTGLLRCEDCIARNGHIKLHLVADL